ncbi:DUF748 domain-containing protein [Shewanella sp. A32]|uniref:DUF748 domain-containing protein n=1 Tax=Shewanella sp. A32 TaxID=3031327 RepID=UPI0023B98474|nr:DUF748 domain-containing protein [Shewanella sp. A32]MDF0533710.1 DUF748 domain-containing protein [Shewanella sp. A32]
MIVSRLQGMTAAYNKAPRSMRISFWLLACYLLYALLLGLITPAIVRSVAPDKMTQLLGRQVALKQLHINPFLLKVRLEDFAIAGKAGEQPLLSLSHAELEFNFWQSVFNRAWCVDHLQLDGLQSQVARTTDTKGNIVFNFDDIVARLQSPETKEAATEPTHQPLPDFRIKSLTLAQSRFAFSDATANITLSYHDINFTLNNFGTRNAVSKDEMVATKPNQYQMSLSGQDNGTLVADGQLLLQPLQVDGNLQLNNITLPPFWGYVQPMLKAKLTEGAISLKTHYLVSQQPDKPLTYAVDNTYVTVNKLQFADGDNPVIKLPKLNVGEITLTSEQQHVNVADVTVDGLWINSRFDQHGLALAPLFTPTSSTKTEESAATAVNKEDASTSKWLIKLAAFNLKNADVNVHEQQISKGVDWRVYPLTVKTGSIDSELSAPLNYQISLDISQSNAKGSGGNFSSEGSINLASKQASGKLTLSNLLLSQFQPYLSHYLNIELPKGQVSSAGDFSADADGHASYKGNVDVSDLEIKDLQQRRPLLKWQQLTIDSLDFDAGKKQLLLGNVTLDKPYAKVTINEDRSTNIGELVVKQASDKMADTQTTTAKTKPAPEATNDGKTEQPFKVTVASINFNNGSAFFADNSLTPNFATGIEQLHGKISSLSSIPGTKATVDIAGKIDRYAPMTLKGEINPLLKQPYLNLDLLFKSVELTTVNPYSGTYAGYYIDKGQLTLALNYQLENNHLNGNNHVVIDQLKLGKPTDSKLATSLPVTLAIALLQDRHGVIDLGLPVSGDLDNPDFSFGGVLLTVLTNVITKAVTAPFSFLAGLISSDEELNLVAFDAGSSKLSKAEQDKLQKLASALADRPKLTLSIEASVDPQPDSQVLAERRLQRQLLQQSGLDNLPDDFSASRIPASGKLTDALLALYQKQFNIDPTIEKAKAEKAATDDKGKVDTNKLTTLWHIGLYNQLLNAETITDADLGNLAQRRSQSVKAFLVDNAAVAPERVFLLDSKTKLNRSKAEAQLSLSAN